LSGALAVEGRFERIADLMQAACDQIGDHEAYVDGDVRLTFAEWVSLADRVAGVLAGHGVGRGDVVALHLGPSVDYAICYAAVARMGAVTSGVNPRLGPREIGSIALRCKPRVVISDAPGAASLWSGATILDRSELLASARQGSPRSPDLESRGSDPVSIIWTSGTTGTPKGAWFDHRNLEAAVASAGVMTHAFDRRISTVPMVHAGYMAKLWEQFAMGVTTVLSPTPWSAETMLETLVKERITVAAGVPTQWSKLMDLPDVNKVDLSPLRIGLVATAPASPELVERVSRTIGCPLVVRYAMTESPSITGTEPDDPVEKQYRTVGRPQEGMSVEIVDQEGRVLLQGDVGRIRIRGPCVMRGYWLDPEHTAEALGEDGALLSGDLGRIDEDGCVVLVGRSGDMYIRGGYNVYPLEVENRLAEHPGVEQVAVLGVSADVIGEIGVAVVVPSPGAAPPTLDDLRVFVGDGLADYKRPDRLVLVDALPLTAMMKIDKAALRADIES
jgi:acyl-CoA synthetase (AMP-forming)/AMP-acid ligase II